MDTEPSATKLADADAINSASAQHLSTSLRSVRRSVPAVFFSESFDVQDPSTFHAACPVGDHGEGECIAALEGHLDMVRSAVMTHDRPSLHLFCNRAVFMHTQWVQQRSRVRSTTLLFEVVIVASFIPTPSYTKVAANGRCYSAVHVAVTVRIIT